MDLMSNADVEVRFARVRTLEKHKRLIYNKHWKLH